MDFKELENRIDELRSEIEELKSNNIDSDLEDIKSQLFTIQESLSRHKHTFRDNTARLNYNLSDNFEESISFEGTSSQFDIYRETGDGGELRIDSRTDQEGSIRIGGLKRPLDVYVYGGDEGILGADNNTNDSFILVEPDKVGVFTDKGNDFFFRLPNGSGDPSATITGALAVVSGVLKIYNGAAWVVVGTQT